MEKTSPIWWMSLECDNRNHYLIELNKVQGVQHLVEVSR